MSPSLQSSQVPISPRSFHSILIFHYRLRIPSLLLSFDNKTFILFFRVECEPIYIIYLKRRNVGEGPCAKAYKSLPSGQSISGSAIRRSLNQRKKVELCSLITSPSFLSLSWLVYFFLMMFSCYLHQGSTISRCCRATKFSLLKSTRRFSKSTCNSLRPFLWPTPSSLPRCLFLGKPTGSSTSPRRFVQEEMHSSVR